MAGRGRGATLPAWMTAGGGATTNGSIGTSDYNDAAPITNNYPPASYGGSYGASGGGYPPQAPPQMQYADARSAGGNDRNYDSRGGERRGTKRERSHSPPSRRGRDGYDRGAGREGREPPHYKWRKRDKSISNFDVRPPDGVELPPIGVDTGPNGIPNSHYSYINPAKQPIPIMPQSGHNSFSLDNALPKANLQSNLETRHARRLYVGGLPPTATEPEILAFFNAIVTRALAPVVPIGPPATRLYLNSDKCYAFVEFDSIELATACMAFDGVRFDHHTGTTILRVRRPNDYRPEVLPPPGPLPVLNLEVLGAAGATGAAVSDGPGKLFVGGLPYALTDEQVLELLSAFGPVKSFHQVRDPGAVNSKGYGFCEYENLEHADQAIAGLNGMALGDKTLTVRYSVPSNAGSSSGALQQMVGDGSNPLLSGLAGLTAPAPIITKVLRLSNMVTLEDLANDAEYADIKEDVRLECQEYGQVLNVLIPRVKDGDPDAAQGYIFVHFASADDARKAFEALNGRKFANNVVSVSYFDEMKFSSGILV